MSVSNLTGLNSVEKNTFIQEYIKKTRFDLLHFHKTHSRFSNNAETDNYFPDEPSINGLRSTKEENGLVNFDKPLSKDFYLVIKHNAVFSALIDQLYPTFNCFAIIRNPLAILASWQTIDMAVNKGRLPVAEAIDINLSTALLSINNTLDRQIFILNWFFARFYHNLPMERIIRYEDVISTKGKCLVEICPQAITMNESLYSKNTNPLYFNQNLPNLVDKLLNSNGMWLHYYSKADIEKLLVELLNINWLPASNNNGQYCVPLASSHRPVSQRILNNEIHESETIEYIKLNCKDGDVVHAGTYFGDFLPAISSALVPEAKIWAFEPNYENYYCTKNTIHINNLQNIEFQNAGLGETNSEANLLIRTPNGKNLGGGSKITSSYEPELTIVVRIVSIDQVIPSDRKISVIHLDVEGYEKQALSGALQMIQLNKPIIIMEDNNDIIETDWFNSNILSIGYIITGKVNNNHIIRFISK